nr:glycosyl hydrolase [uncultured Acetatifactor sp.]
MHKELREKLKNPDSFYRSFPFWAWNGKLDPEELVRQVRLMQEAGVGGFFIHSRDGLETEYLSAEWMECVKAVVAEAKRLGLYAWLYDEDRWPSGTAGGKVTACQDAYRCKGLTLEVTETWEYTRLYESEIRGRDVFTDDRNGVLAVYAARVKGDEIFSCRRLSMQEEENFAEGECLLTVRLEVSAPSEWFNQETPPDNLNPDCVRKFIEETHEKYKAVVGEEFGKTVPGIFTDEPSLHDRHAFFGEKRSWIPWTYHYGAYFREFAGYDFLETVPWLYFNGEKSRQTRRDYWSSITKRYGEAYFKTIGEWCEKNNLLFTGHFLQEDKMGLAVRVNGAIMPHYRYQHVPGIDLLCEQTAEYMTVKQCTSVARQLGKKQVLTETYGCTGWEFTFEGQKWIGDWQYVLGVNRRCQHLALYSLRGCRKRDYPPSFNYNTSWWSKNRLVEDYFARLSVLLEQGEAVREILLLHPVSTVWGKLGCSPYGNPLRRKERDVPGLNQYGDCFNELIAFLMRKHLDCDLGDEMLIKEFGAVQNGRFRLGEALYEAVVIPSGMEILLPGTAEMLMAYMEQGGYVYALQPCVTLRHPHFVTVKTKEALEEKLEKYRTIHIENGEGAECTDVLYQLRKCPDGYVLFLVNNNRHRAVEAKVSLPFCATLEEVDLLSGEECATPFYQNGGSGLTLCVHLDRTGSAVYLLKPCRVRETVFPKELPYRLDRPNILTLDFCRYRLDGENWSEKMEVWQAQRQIRERLGMRQIYYNGLEQRYKWISKNHPGDGHFLELTFEFEAEEVPENAVLAVERLTEFKICINDTTAVNDILKEQIWILDREFETVSLSGIQKGRNRILLSCEYRNHMELENLYLAGRFGVSEDRKLTALPEKLLIGDWTKQGLQHYCGSVHYILEYDCHERNSGEEDGFAKILLILPEIKAVCVEVRINGKPCSLRWNAAGELSVGNWLQQGRNLIEIEAVGSPRNMMGPFHLKEKPYNTHDASFCPPPEAYCEGYLLTPYGLMGEVRMLEIEEKTDG